MRNIKLARVDESADDGGPTRLIRAKAREKIVNLLRRVGKPMPVTHIYCNIPHHLKLNSKELTSILDEMVNDGILKKEKKNTITRRQKIEEYDFYDLIEEINANSLQEA